jgi:hypothetical protein
MNLKPIPQKNKMRFFTCMAFVGLCFSAFAQQKMQPGGMSYLINPKPNTIVYHDSVFSGSKQFEQLFYRTGDFELIQYVQRHQSNKIAGQAAGFIGAIAMIWGISTITSGSGNKGVGWALTAGGFIGGITGSYLTLKGQQNLAAAVLLFNRRYSRASLSIGFGEQRTGLAFNF